MLFGTNTSAASGFLFFTDFHGDLAKAVREGRAKEFTGHSGHDGDVPDPNDEQTFARSKLDWHNVTTAQGKSHHTGSGLNDFALNGAARAK